jgi:hypothetical protein
MPAKGQSGGGGLGGGGMRGGGGSGRSGGQKKIVSISTKKPLTPAQIKAREVKARVDKVKKSEAAQDLKSKNLNNFNKKFDRKPRAAVTKKNNSPFGPVAAGIVKPKVAPKSPKLNNRAKAAIGVTAATANAVRISKNKKKSVPVPRDRKKQ